ncbi:hypothetical protein B484DRAFT_171938 [Ochromonadaceae sp. CCMP2298]|nr:hypothetical protein B484DRAFT_171938 [Ochromonadaceae sp. CCMP2298]
MIDRVNNIIQQVEAIMRGGGNANAMQSISISLKENAKDLLTLISASIPDSAGTSEDKEGKLASAVKLHNKARNLTSQCHTEARCYLKAIAAWMFLRYGEQKASVHGIVIKLLSKSGQEMMTMAEGQELAGTCLSTAVQLWNTGASLSFQKDIPPHDLQDIKLSAFWAQMSLMSLLSPSQRAEMKMAVSGAMELVQTLTARLKITFAERIIRLGHQAAHGEMVQEAIHYYQVALSSIDSAMLPMGMGEEAQSIQLRKCTEVKQLRLEAQLALVYVYIDQK